MRFTQPVDGNRAVEVRAVNLAHAGARYDVLAMTRGGPETSPAQAEEAAR